ncbi:hypothetical protein A3SI_09757 [Nitritalea halalkaliphila LW7]|uniref:Uncharacterized protein n=1 Tax=Nitritalea halalkaliphila LW7 TaxID=1189621 RepID=I5C3S3_9BACT|nr:hypothetical protein [Nitritalea halalkaliphila]EIM76475.1 hypothetical protein A3SI_09757 [Nitritalea halalkaliphila LW7]
MELPIGYLEALACMRKASHPNGFLASSAAGENYPRIWARDGVITGLAALASRDEALIETFRRTLQRLGEFQSPEGHIPSNVATDSSDVSLGGLAGRADTGSWWVIGLCLYAHWTGDRAFLLAQSERIAQVFRLYQAWEYNNRDLLYVPLAGDWADEYLLHGYTLYDQILRCAALKLAGKALQVEAYSEKASRIQLAIEKNYWLASPPDATCIHPSARKRLLKEKGALPYLLAGFHPAGYQPYLDLFGNALAMLFDLHPDPTSTLAAVPELAPSLPVFLSCGGGRC